MVKNSHNLNITMSIVVIAGLYRALIVPGDDILSANLTPLCAIALFAGAQISSSKLKYLTPVLVLLLSDYILYLKTPSLSATALFYPGWMWVYGSILVSAYLGSKILHRTSLVRVLLGAISVSLCHWLISDVGYFLSGGINILTGQPYPFSTAGLFQCIIMGFPFFKKTLLATVLFSFLFFYAYKALNQLITFLKTKSEYSN